MSQSRDERERLQLRYNEVGLALATAQDDLEEVRTQAGANREATAAMSRQIAVLVEDHELRRQEMDLLRRQLEASTTSALEAQPYEPHIHSPARSCDENYTCKTETLTYTMFQARKNTSSFQTLCSNNVPPTPTLAEPIRSLRSFQITNQIVRSFRSFLQLLLS